eukprot:TRINITY_DN1549_c0_g2_i3.p2 TRINITY_DN1549_c0_g2~~TRINITY_DN1549_c0_g2_i3.p2  ORF type:complete len:274 (-),score=23.29 TRINITY_DN1549_c0_g2_i3:294-1115(-)
MSFGSGSYGSGNLLFRPGEPYSRHDVMSPDRTRSPSAKPGGIGIGTYRDGMRRRSTTPQRRSSRSPSRNGTRDRSPYRESRENQPPPPPIDSLFIQEDEDMFVQRQAMNLQQGKPEGTSLLPIMGVQEMQQPWVTIFGIQQEDIPALLEELSKCGAILRYGSFGAPQQANWIHVEFESKYAAQTALQMNGMVLGSNSRQVIIGVQPLSDQHKAMINQAGAGMILEDVDARTEDTKTFLQPAKPYNLPCTQGRPLPKPVEKTVWSYFYEAVIGS